eukprot:SAG25_NODE_15_length_24441_cov_175.207288_15_plen_193_part_00
MASADASTVRQTQLELSRPPTAEQQRRHTSERDGGPPITGEAVSAARRRLDVWQRRRLTRLMISLSQRGVGLILSMHRISDRLATVCAEVGVQVRSMQLVGAPILTRDSRRNACVATRLKRATGRPRLCNASTKQTPLLSAVQPVSSRCSECLCHRLRWADVTGKKTAAQHKHLWMRREQYRIYVRAGSPER